MVDLGVGRYRHRVRTELDRAFAGTHPPHDVAVSFAIGVIITTLPALGTGLILFVESCISSIG